MTAGGLHGRILELGDTVVTLELAQNVRVRVERSKIETTAGTGKKAGTTSKSGKDK